MTDPTASLRDRIADVVIPLLLDTLPKVIARSRGYEVADTVLAVLPPPADRAAILAEAADAVFALDYDVMVGEEGDENLGSMREAWDLGTIHAEKLLRRLAAEKEAAHLSADRAAYAQGIRDAIAELERDAFGAIPRLRRLAAEAQPVCAECGHPHAAHREGDDPVTPGTCSACTDDDRHDYVPAAEAQQGAATAFAPSAPGANEPASSVAAEAPTTTKPETTPRRGDAFEQWLKAQRDEYETRSSREWRALDEVLDTYRLHADTGTPLGEHVCEGRTVGDCECLEPAAEAQP